MNNIVKCTNCGTDVSMTAAIENEIRKEEQKKSEAKFAQLKSNNENEIRKRDEQIAEMRKGYVDAISKVHERENDVNKREANIQEIVKSQLKEQTPQIEEKISKMLEEKYKDRLASTNKIANENKIYADEASKREGALLVEKNELLNQIRQMEIDNQRKLVEEKEKIYNEGLQKGTNDSKQQVLLLENKLESANKHVEEMQRMLDQGSQKAQGDVWEKEIGDILQSSFTRDKIEKIQNGTRGGDIVHTVISAMGKPAGVMLWEVKNTAKWDASWIAKIKEDQRKINAEFAIIVTRTLPKNAERFIYIDDVVVTDFQTFPVTAALVREAVLSIYKVRTLGVNVEQNLKAIHNYLTSTHFIQIVQKNLECITRIGQVVDNDEKYLAKSRGILRTSLQIMQCSISEMYGELQGIIGEKLENLPQFETENLITDGCSHIEKNVCETQDTNLEMSSSTALAAIDSDDDLW